MASDKKQALTQFHRQAIINAAGRLFMEYGIAATTMEDIAKEAGYSKSTVYNYFGSKIEINNAIAWYAMALLGDRVIEALDSREDFHEQYDAMCEAMIEYQRDFPYYFKRLTERIDYSIDSNGESPWLHEVFVVGERMTNAVRSFFRRGMELGILREELPVHRVYLVLWFAMSGFIQVSDYKRTYITQTLDTTQEEFVRYGLKVLLRAYEK